MKKIKIDADEVFILEVELHGKLYILSELKLYTVKAEKDKPNIIEFISKPISFQEPIINKAWKSSQFETPEYDKKYLVVNQFGDLQLMYGSEFLYTDLRYTDLPEIER